MYELVALTGATGFIGSAFLKALTNSGIKVRALSREPRVSNDLIEWVTGDLNSPQALAELVDDATTIIHCAGTVRGKSEQDFLAVNMDGTVNLLSACKASTTDIRFLLISSLAAREPELSWYAQSKFKAEQKLRSQTGNIDFAIFRPTAIYGPGDKEIHPLIKAMKIGLLPHPNVKSQFSLLHINDLVSAMLQWSNSDLPVTGIYELDDGTANGYNWDSLVELAKDNWQLNILKIPIPITLLNMFATSNLALARLINYAPMLTPGKIREIKHPSWICDNSSLTEVLGWQPTIKLADAMLKPALLQL